MGKTIKTKASGTSESFDVDKGADGKPQTIHVEEYGKSITFIDTNNPDLTCQVPKMVWMKAWKRLSRSVRQGEAEAFDYIDRSNNTVLIVKTLLKEENGGESYSVNAELKVRRLADTNNIYTQLQLFSESL